MSGPPELHCMNKILYFKFKSESKVSFSPAPLAALNPKLYFIAYLVESGFSWVTYLPSKVRNCLDAVTRDYLPLSLTTLQPDVQKLARNTLNTMPIIN